MEEEISESNMYYNDVSPFVWFTAALVVIIFAYVLEVFRKKALFRENDGGGGRDVKSLSLVECNLPNCVRCTKNVDILQRALKRLSVYSIPSPTDKFQEVENDISNLTRDLKETLDSKILVTEASRELSVMVTATVSTPSVFFMRGLREDYLFPARDFPGLDKLEDDFEKIRLEFLHLYQSPLEETKLLWKKNTTDSGTWELSHLVDQGRITKAGELCPLTMSLLRLLPSFMNSNLFGNAAFSIVHPQTEIATHCGSTNFRIRCHLGLQIPSGLCKLHVNDTQVEWEEGEVVCFNDAFPHSVHHQGGDSSGFRAVLLIDLWHPDVTKSQRKILNHIYSPAE